MSAIVTEGKKRIIGKKGKKSDNTHASKKEKKK